MFGKNSLVSEAKDCRLVLVSEVLGNNRMALIGETKWSETERGLGQ